MGSQVPGLGSGRVRRGCALKPLSIARGIPDQRQAQFNWVGDGSWTSFASPIAAGR